MQGDRCNSNSGCDITSSAHYHPHASLPYESIFRETLDEYKAEGIDVAAVGFRDNDAQVALVDGRPTWRFQPTTVTTLARRRPRLRAWWRARE